MWYIGQDMRTSEYRLSPSHMNETDVRACIRRDNYIYGMYMWTDQRVGYFHSMHM